MVELDPTCDGPVVVVELEVEPDGSSDPTARVLLYTVIRRTTVLLPVAPLAEVDAEACLLTNRAAPETSAIPPQSCVESPGHGVSHASLG